MEYIVGVWTTEKETEGVCEPSWALSSMLNRTKTTMNIRVENEQIERIREMKLCIVAILSWDSVNLL